MDLDVPGVLELHEAYLRQLEEQEAHFGTAYCPTHILVEIEFLRRRIQSLQMSTDGRAVNTKHNLPYRPALVGRDRDVENALSRVSKSTILTIVGPAGIGKTSLAINVAYTLLERKQFERVIWVTAKDSYVSLVKLLDEIGRAISQVDVVKLELIEKEQRVLSALRHSSFLIVIDNYETITDKNLFDFLEVLPPPSKALLTSRTQCKFKSQKASSLLLSGLSLAAINKLIAQELVDSGIVDTQERDLTFSQDIFELTRGNPLVTKWLLGRAQDIGASIEEVINELKEGKSEVLPQLFEKLTVSLEQNSQTLLILLALIVDSTDRNTIREILSFSEGELAHATQPLVARYLVDIPVSSIIGGEVLYSLHPLTRSYTLNYLASDIRLRKVRNLVISFFRGLVETQCKDIHVFDHELLERNIKNILVTMDYCYEHQRWDDYLAFHKLYYFLGERGFWTERNTIASRTLEVARRTDRLDVVALTLADNLGWLLIQQDLLDEAGRVVEEAFQVYAEIEDTYGLANALRNLGLIRRDTGEIDEAQQLFERALEVAVANGHNKVSADTYISLGSMAKDKGDLIQAKTFYNKALTHYKLAQYDTGVGWALGDLGHLARLQNEYEEAKALYSEALEKFMRINRLDRIAAVREGLAILEKAIGNLTGAFVSASEAEELYLSLGMLAKARRIAALKEEIAVSIGQDNN